MKMVKKKERKGLGRGLSALMADIDSGPVAEKPSSPIVGDTLLPIEQISPNLDQPRRDFKQDDLNDLAASIAGRGIIQPIIVRPDPQIAGQYQIVAGERRWRAAQQAKLHEIPVLIREFDDEQLLEVAIIENVQRSDLNAVEEALGYRALMDRFGHTQEQVSSALGKSRSYIANILRLLNLPVEVQQYVREGRLSVGHARTLIGNDKALEFANAMIKGDFSVREAESLVKQGLKPKSSGKRIAKPKDSDTRAIETDLGAILKMGVLIDHKDESQAGKITISYKSLDDLDRLCSILMGATK
tara:strand:+ start:1261 stop:2160 length:900 start_codon:yes stop_codon:yes gene_type:complete